MFLPGLCSEQRLLIETSSIKPEVVKSMLSNPSSATEAHWYLVDSNFGSMTIFEIDK